MAKEHMIFCKYCSSEYTQWDYALHRLTTPHIKKIKRDLLQSGFSSVCLVCNCELKDLKHVEAHVQEKTHTDWIKSLLVDNSLSGDKCTCDTCGILFYNEVALEAHHLMPSHESAANLPNLPKLNELARQLSGLPGEWLTPNVSPLCIICNVRNDGLEDLIEHLFAPAHLFRLRSSTCIVCNRDFTHASDRELHLRSSKHHSILQNYSNLLEEVHRQTLLNKGGYPCMYCMVWCNSWYCLELHLLDSHHSKVSGERKAKHPAPLKINFSVSREIDCQDPACDVSATSNWREWREETSGEHAWCHRCGIILLGPDAANQHLKDHGLERGPIGSKSHPPKALDFSSTPPAFECSVCTLSFKSAFSLRVHEACFEHHCRIAASPSTDDLGCCANCGVLVDKEAGDGVTACEDLKESQHQSNDAELSTECLQLPQNQIPAINTNKIGPDSNVVVSNIIMQTADSFQVTQRRLIPDVSIKRHPDIIEANILVPNTTLQYTNTRQVVQNRPLSDGGSSSPLTEKGNTTAKISQEVLLADGTVGAQRCSSNQCHSKLNNFGVESTAFGTENQPAFTSSNAIKVGAGSPGSSSGSLAGKSSCTAGGVFADETNIRLESGSLVVRNEPNNLSKDQTMSAGSHEGLVANGCLSSEPNKASLIEEGNGWHSEVSLTDAVAEIPTVSGEQLLACAGLGDDFVQQDPVPLAAKVSDDSSSKLRRSAIHIRATDFGIPIVAAATLAPLETLQESLQSVMAIVTESLLAALPMYMQQPASLLKGKTHRGSDEQTADHQPVVKRMCPEKILEAALHQGLQSGCLNSTSIMKDSDVKSQEKEAFEDSLTGGVDFANKEKARHNMVDDKSMEPRAILAVAASVVLNSHPELSGSTGVQGQVVVTEAKAVLATQNSSGPSAAAQQEVSKFPKVGKLENNLEREGVQQVVVGDLGSAERNGVIMEAEEGPLKIEVSQPSSLLACAGMEKHMTGMQMPHANDIVGHEKEELFLEANKLPIATTEVGMSISEENDSNDDDCYDILYQLKGQNRWWILSDSEGTE